jgi:hypothetical protein
MVEKVELKVEPEEVRLVGGDKMEVKATIKNTGQTIDQLTLDVEGLEPDWYTLPVSSVALFPNDEDDLRILIHPPRALNSKPGTYPFRVNITSKENPDEITSSEAVIAIRPPLDLELVISPQSITGRKGLYDVTVKYPGNRDLTVNLDACDTGKKLRCTVEPSIFSIPAGGMSNSRVEIKPGLLAFFGGKKKFEFQVGAATHKEGLLEHNYCPFCGHLLCGEEDLPTPLARWPRIENFYTRICKALLHHIRSDYEYTPVFCPVCSEKLRSDAVIERAQFVRTPWYTTLPRIRLRRLKLPRFRLPSLT